MPLPANMTYLMMIKEAISSLKERGGSSLQAIKKYIHETYPDVDVQGVSQDFFPSMSLSCCSIFFDLH